MAIKNFRLIGLFLALISLLVACNGDGSLFGSTETPTIMPTATPSLVVRSIDEVNRATIQIEAQGSFVDPEYGAVSNVAGRGSGFIISESGLAVTNNHVVTGSALIKVWVGGENEPRNARILGVSECSDLALIDLEGDGYNYFEWYEGEIKPGLDIYAAGFPLGDPEFTLNRGIISKARANGDTSWASVDSVIEHDAIINPGNSGGPLITADAKVVGVNYANNEEARQSFAISHQEVTKILDRLSDEENVDSIGINGEAFLLDDGFSGIWVSSVESGSFADKAGIQGGDILTEMEDLVLATDGTMADYCDIIRSHSPDDTLSIEVYRSETDDMLAGQLNGDELEIVVGFNRPGVSLSPGEPYSEYVTLTDDLGAITIDIPQAWGDVDLTPLVDDEGDLLAAAIVASPDIEDFFETWSQPGVYFFAFEFVGNLSEEEVLDEVAADYSDDCETADRYEYDDGLYTGLYEEYNQCGIDNVTYIEIVASPEDRPFMVVLEIQLVTEADMEALDHIIESFQVIGDLP